MSIVIVPWFKVKQFWVFLMSLPAYMPTAALPNRSTLGLITLAFLSIELDRDHFSPKFCQCVDVGE